MTLKTPYLPNEAKNIAREWMREHKQPAFVVAVNHDYGGLTCPNCNDIGGVYLKLCSAGPYQTPRSHTAVFTWFDGNETYRKGWYIVKEMMTFICPECNGIPRERGPWISGPRVEELKAAEGRLARRR